MTSNIDVLGASCGTVKGICAKWCLTNPLQGIVGDLASQSFCRSRSGGLGLHEHSCQRRDVEGPGERASSACNVSDSKGACHGSPHLPFQRHLQPNSGRCPYPKQRSLIPAVTKASSRTVDEHPARSAGRGKGGGGVLTGSHLTRAAAGSMHL